MTTDILFFGRLAERLGRSVSFDLPETGLTIAGLRQGLAKADPAADILLNSGVRASIDREIVGENARAHPGQEIAFLPVFSGG